MSPLSQVINKDLLKTALETHLKSNVNILSFTVNNAVAAGDNYCSEIKRIVITYSIAEKEENSVSVIVKHFPENEILADFVKDMEFFDCELVIYGGIFPALLKFDYREKIIPQVYYISENPFPVVILEDLTTLNYKLHPRRNGLDLEHCLMVVEKLAYFHAATVALCEKDPTIFSKHNKTMFRNTKVFSAIINLAYEELITACTRHPGLHKYIDKLKKKKKDIVDKMYNIHEMDTKFKVLNHGDCWSNNILFYYNNDGSLADLAFVDFQVCCYTSPCLDLHYFLACSVKFNTRSQYNVIIDHYFNYLIKNLNKLHAKTIPKREEFDEDFQKTAYYGFGASTVLLPAIKATNTQNASVENLINDDGEDSFRYHCFTNKNYVKEMSHFLPFYEKLCIFDI